MARCALLSASLALLLLALAAIPQAAAKHSAGWCALPNCEISGLPKLWTS